MTQTPPTPHGSGYAATLGRWVMRVGSVVLTVVALEFLAVHLVAARDSWHALHAGRLPLLVAALVLELASFACFSGITRLLLPRTDTIGYRWILAVDLTGNGVAHVVPGGTATAAAFRFRLLGRLGVPFGDAVGMATLESAVNSLWLVAALALGLLVAVPHPATGPVLRVAALIAVVLLAVFSGLIAVLMARPDLVVSVSRGVARRLPGVRAGSLERLARVLIDQVRLVTHSARYGRRLLLLSAGNWLLDAACLFLCVCAFGPLPNPGGLVTTYALVCLLAMLPLTPGGLGLVEGVAVPTLVSFGTPNSAALLGVLTWRAFEFWLPIPLAGATSLWLRRHRPRADRRSE